MSDWLAELAADYQRARAAAAERAAERERQLAEHRRECRAPVCTPCGRHPCSACGAVAVDARGRRCALCALAPDLDAFRESIPARFQDIVVADRAGAVTVLERRPVQLSRERLVAALEWAASTATPPGLVLVGPLRVGKTSTAVALLSAWFVGQHAAQRGAVRRARFVDAISLGLAREHHRLGEEAPMVLDAIAASVLVLDDLGQEPQRHGEVIRHVVRARSDAMLPTWITTWLDRDELTARYDDAGFAARVYESKRVQLGGERDA